MVVTLTKQPTQVLGTIHVSDLLSGVLPGALVKPRIDLLPLCTLETVEEKSAKAFVEIFTNARDDLFQDVCIGATRPALCTLIRGIVVQKQ